MTSSVRITTALVTSAALLGLAGRAVLTLGDSKPVTPAQPTAGKPGKPEVVPVDKLFVLPNATKEHKRLSPAELRGLVDDPKNYAPVLPVIPVGLAGMGDFAKYVPVENPLSRAKVELGRQLYFDTRLSGDGTVSCASCHKPEAGWAEHSKVSTGINNQLGGRNAPTVFNRVFAPTQFWDGRAASLEEQALGPIENQIEMGAKLPDVVKKLRSIEGYRVQFEKLYGDVTAEGIARSIASFERVVMVGGSAYDYAELLKAMGTPSREDLDEDKQLAALYESAKKQAAARPMSAAAKRGQLLFFGKANCSLCHVGANFTDEFFYNIGVGMAEKDPNPGRMAVTKKPADYGAYKTPSLRNVAENGPYMHDGSEATLTDVVEYYDKGGTPNKNLHPRIKKLGLTKQEKEDLVAFMEALTGEPPVIRAPKLP